MTVDEAGSSSEWTREQDKAFENALATYSEDASDRWEKIAADVTGKTLEEIKHHYELLVDDINQIESDCVPLPAYNSTSEGSTSHGGDEGTGKKGGHLGHYNSESNHGSKVSKSDQERRKGNAWTEDEHRLFLLGLDKYGKGDWRSISRNFVVTRTPTQVASHAQKYFIRLNLRNKDRRRSSIHDITSVGNGDISAPQGNWNMLSMVAPAYSVPKSDEKSTQTVLTQLTGSSNSEEEGDAETREEGDVDGDEPNPKKRMTDAETSEVPLSRKIITEPKTTEQTISEIDLLDDVYNPNFLDDLWDDVDGDEPNPKKRMTDAETSEVPLSHKTVTEPKITVQTISEIDLLDDVYNPNHGEETHEKQIASKPHDGLLIDFEAFKMTDSNEQKKFKIEEIGNEVSQTRNPMGTQVEEMQPQAFSTLKPQGVVFDVEAVKILKSSGQVEFQIEPEASKQLFLMQGGLGLTKPPKDEDWKNAKEIYLMDNELSVLPENPRCPNLSALFLPRNYKLRMIPQPFFYYMPALQILNLSKTSIKSLPDSVIKLVSLKRLFLNDCHRLMMLSPKVGDLEQLEVLDLEGAKIIDLPKEIKKLTNMTCLEVSFYGYSSNDRRAMPSNAVIPRGVICSLSQLEELNIDVNPDDERWDARVEDIVNEVCTLKRLETLKFYFPRVELLRHFKWNSLKLSHFRFTVGCHVKRIMSRVPCDAEFELERWEKCLKYINGVGVPEDIKKVLQHAVAFFLDRHATVKKLSDFGLRNMKQLKCCVMGECNEVQVIVDEADADEEDDTSKIVSDSYGTERIVLGSLEYLYIYYMKNLRSIWEGSAQKNSLFLLKSLTLRTCPQLTTIFTQGLLDNLCNLEELKVEDCPSIKSIVSCEISAEPKTSYSLPNLKKISLHYMPGLVSISSGLYIAPKLEWLSFYNCPDLKNPLIDEICSQDLKKIKGERSWWEALEWSNSCPSYLEEIFVPIDIRDC